MPNPLKSVRKGTGIVSGLNALYVGTFLHSNGGNSHLPHGLHGGHLVASKLSEHLTTGVHLGHIGGTICDLSIYKSSSPGGIFERGIPFD